MPGPASSHRIIRIPSGTWRRYEHDVLIDEDTDDPLEEIFKWATAVVHYETRRLAPSPAVARWVAAGDDTYHAEPVWRPAG